MNGSEKNYVAICLITNCTLTGLLHVATHLQCPIFEANAPSPVLYAVYSIDWAEQLDGLLKVSDHPIVFSLVSVSH